MLDKLRWVPRRGNYWEQRARDLIETYDRPETWDSRNWLRDGVEDETVPALLREHGCRTVLVPGAGSGRQYSFLGDFEVTGFDLSPTMVRECRRRYPQVETAVGEVVGCQQFGRFDAVVTSAVLAHISEEEIVAAIASVKQVAARLVIVREYTWLAEDHSHQWARDYDRLFSPWPVVYRERTDDRADGQAELIAFEAPPSGSLHGESFT